MQRSVLQVTMAPISKQKNQTLLNNLFTTGCQARLSAEGNFYYLLQHTVIYIINCMLYGEI